MKKIGFLVIVLLCCVTVFAQTAKPVAKAVAKPVKKPVATKPAAEKTFSNGIKMVIKGFVVSDVKLYFEDGSVVPGDNTIELNQKVIMQVVIDSGYKVTGGKVFPGGSEEIKLSDGYEVLSSDDMFAQYDETGVSPEDGKYISLKAVMKELNDKSKAVIVSFKIWDKKGSSVITGSYKLHIK
jgi:hypothetical protein